MKFKLKSLKRKLGFRGPIMLIMLLLLPILIIIYSPVKIIMGSLNGLMTFSSVVFVLWMISALFIGRGGSCGYLCPYGALSEVMGGWLMNKKARSPLASKIKYLSFAGFLALIIFSRRVIGRNSGFDPFLISDQVNFLNIDSYGVMLMVIAFTVLVGISSIAGNRAFCRYLCPQAIFLYIPQKVSSIIKIPSLNLKADPEKCDSCQRCNWVCPMGLEVMELVKEKEGEHLISHSDCISCGDCIRDCKKGSIKYSFGIPRG